MRVPAICDNCGAFFPSGFEVTNSTNVGFSNVKCGPCPSCGGMGHIPDGIYNFIGNTIELLSGPSRTVSELLQFAEILRNAQKKNVSLEDIAKELDQKIPELSSFKDILPKSRSELYAFIALILSAIALLLPQLSSSSSNKIEINNVITNVYQQLPSDKPKQLAKKAKPERKNRKVGRNEPCPCGSGRKYKKCCLYRV